MLQSLYLAIEGKIKGCTAYMTESQEFLLKRFGGDIICIDGTHGTNAYGFELTTVMVVDDNLEGYPVAFLFHSSKTEATYTAFFEELKKRVGTITSNIFMSDDEIAFWNAWQTVMGATKQRLLCTWHVLRNWKKHVQKLPLALRDGAITKLRAIMEEPDEMSLKISLEEVLRQWSSDAQMKEIGQYIKEYYTNRTEMWAHCYRQHCKINTNMRLEKLHKDLKHVYMGGKKTKRLDKAFQAVRDYLEDKQYNRLISIFRGGKRCAKYDILRQRHGYSEDMPLSHVYDSIDGEQSWTVSSQKVNGRYYTVKQVEEKCQREDCQLLCRRCNICYHLFQCSCPDSSIKMNMCKHIHLLGRYLLEGKKIDSEQDDDSAEDQDGMFLHINDFQAAAEEEAKVHMLELTRNKMKTIDDVKLKIEEQHRIALDLISTLEEGGEYLKGIENQLALLRVRKKTVEVFPERPSSPGRNMKPQLRFESTKKKNVRPPPPQDNRDVIGELISQARLRDQASKASLAAAVPLQALAYIDFANLRVLNPNEVPEAELEVTVYDV